MDNLPEKDISTSSQCTTPCVQSASSSLRQMDSADSVPRNLPPTSNSAKPTTVPSPALCSDSAGCENTPRDTNTTFSVQCTSVTSQLQTSVITNTDQCSMLEQSTSYHLSTSVAAQTGLHSTSCSQLYNVCLASQQPAWPQSVAVRQPPHSRLDISTTRDILPSCITVPSNSGRSGHSCITSSSSGRHGLSAYDSNSHSVNWTSVDGLGVLRSTSAPHWHSQSHAPNRPLVSSNLQRTPMTRSTASDRITTRN